MISENYELVLKTVKSIINASYDGIYITDGCGNTIMVNQSYERITGISIFELLDKNMKDLVREGYFSQSASLHAIKKRGPVSVRQKLISGKEILATAMPVFMNDDINEEIIFVVTNVRDVPELMKIKAELKDELSDTKALNEKLRQELKLFKEIEKAVENLIIKDSKMNAVVEMALRIAKFDSNVLLTGDTGVGKSEIAKLIHQNSLRKNEKLIEVNCGAIPANLVESELFGYEKGAFTGAVSMGRQGFFGLADKGTLFLDEISEAPFNAQVKLLQVIQDKIFYKIGNPNPQKADVRIIAATNKDLMKLVQEGKFREDLYYRLCVTPIHILSLRERKDDIVPLALKFLKNFNEKFETSKYFTSQCLNTMVEYDWPGNVRELTNLVERLVILAKSDRIEKRNLPAYIQNTGRVLRDRKYEGLTLKDAVHLFETELIRDTIENEGSIRKAAKKLDVDPSTITRKMSKN